ncbi:hypothetical protein QJS04_geneDACA010932 [Acorus gramineus]|uniref:Transposase-associated domain-containing protein n=1 Tax=Acorus gramineus TaxID=55184 RepID=A0AAV9BIB9_ACOGR|nr:hypothetical protein QJS04_geneDACA010932 [Acorus gramineus]
MDKSWMQCSRWSDEYFMGMNKFLDFAFEKVGTHGKNNCPCTKCSHRLWYDRRIVVDHLLHQGFSMGYTHWIYHVCSYICDQGHIYHFV